MSWVASQVSRSFDRGAGRYQQLALAQQEMGLLLWNKRPPTAEALLDLGSGPGHWTARLAKDYPEARVAGLDLSAAMIRQAKTRYPALNWIRADAANLPLASASLDLIFSNLAIQWCPQTKALLAGIYRILKTEGRALITTLLPGSLDEIHQAWEQAGASSRVLAFQSQANYQQAAVTAGFRSIQLEASRQVFYYPTSRDLLQSVSGIGASGGAGQLTKTQYRRIHQLLDSRRTSQGLPLTYQLLVMELIK
ncbi:malonyl-CoA O-methyltransferase [Marinospirillum celere]|uniref:Malonyl-[acyl-carrier protein] O-methyltransferase n=1 Tax=Marinospirillum celere TaxID=1122252 RepID=A0A1I1E3W7_9GAMM|nr:methyltransferase domain-containing protein [Marinospirillum celere]SFB79918.1 malonyl-CoA O-methyltransferase [Marinospirillum celere]